MNDEEMLFGKVLLIEDDPAHVTLIRRVLRDFASDVEHVSTLAAAVAEISKSKPDLIVTDLNLADSNRLSGIKRIRELAPELPVVVLTSSNSLSDAVEAMKMGARDFIVKNFDASFRELFGLALSRVRTALVLEQERAQLERDMEILRVAIENSSEGLAVANSNGSVTYCNTAFRAFVKRCGGNISRISELFSEPVKNAGTLSEDFGRKLKELAPGAAWSTEVGLSEDKNANFEFNVSSVQAKHGERENVVWVKDISEVKRRERFQREILSTTTHDLKGPLGAISISADLLREMVQQEGKVKELILRVASSAQSALNLIDEFLSARRIQEGSLILKPTSCEVSSVIAESVSQFEALGRSKKIELSVEVAQNIKSWSFDRLGIQRVVGNLLSNAMKFTPKGGKVSVRARIADNDLKIAVEDTGSGMEPAEVQKIFERFSRLEKHTDVAGSGLGLFVVKSVVTAHGGKIEVTSQPGRGSCFEVSLPQDPPVNDRGELISLDFA